MSVKFITVCLLIASVISIATPSQAAIKVVCHVLTVTFDDTNIVIVMAVHPTTKDTRTKDFTGVAANIADNAAILAFLRQQVVNYVLAQYSVTIVASEVAIVGAPQ